ncbi:MAG: two-component system, OmpR family, response regulator MprA [Chloroflexota bacterium]|nr:two-component system, OmpR family, response regulator MprA [Chloroflexota bacterium]
MNGRPVLVVDDDPVVREALCLALECEGYPVAAAANGFEALGMISEARPSLVLLDMHMPTLDGPGLTRAMDDRGFDPPIVVMTATSRDVQQVALAVGAQAWVAKPFDLAELLALVARLRIP